MREVAAYKRARSSSPSWIPTATRRRSAHLAKAGVTAFAMELMPRITRAQAMDVLSSQANLAGYRAVIDGAADYGRALPMMMTAAGTVPATKVFVMGAGVAGLQAIATARRLGAIVTATDVRPAAKEQVESLGAKVHRRRGRGVQAGRNRRRLRQGNVEGVSGKAGRARRRARQEAGHRHHHGADSGPSGAAPDLGRDGAIDAAWLGHRRPRGRAWRQRRRRQAGCGDRRERREDRRLSQRSRTARRVSIEPLCAQPVQLRRVPDRQEDQDACRELGRRDRQSDRADPRRRRHPSELSTETGR